jgi:hypothetical protein
MAALTQEQNKEAFWGDKLTIDGLRISKKPSVIPLEVVPSPAAPIVHVSESSLPFVSSTHKSPETSHSPEELASEVDVVQDETRVQLYRQQIILTLLREGLEDLRRKTEQRQLSKSSAVAALDLPESTDRLESCSSAVVIDAPIVMYLPPFMSDQPAVDATTSSSNVLCDANQIPVSMLQHDADNKPTTGSAGVNSCVPIPVPDNFLDASIVSAPALTVVDDSKMSRVKRLLHTYMDTVAKTDKREKRKAQKFDGVDHPMDDESRSKRVRTNEPPFEKTLDELLLPALMEQMLAFLQENPRACLPCSRNRAGCLLSERNKRAREMEQLDGDEWIPSLDDDPW